MSCSQVDHDFMSTEISFEHFDPTLELGTLDENGKPIRPKKKPGRKPNPPSPAQRKAQNRAAQRAFRERKQREMREAEHTIRRTVFAREKALKDLAEAQKRIKQLEYESQHLKGMLLTYKVACFSHGVDVPKFWAEAGNTTDAYGAEVLSYSKCKTVPHALELYLDKDLHIITDTDEDDQTQVYKPIPGAFPMPELDPENMQLTLTNFPIPLPLTAHHLEALLSCNIFPNIVQQLNAGDLKFFTNPNIQTTTPIGAARESSVAKEEPLDDEAELRRLKQENDEGYKVLPPMTPVDALKYMRQEPDAQHSEFTALFEPTELQMTVPHDSRIDIVPGAGMRDRMIIFRDLYDANELFTVLLESSFFLGGQIGDPDCWYVPPSFLKKFWYLCPNHLPMRRADNSMEIMINLGHRMTEKLWERKGMHTEREKYVDHFPAITKGFQGLTIAAPSSISEMTSAGTESDSFIKESSEELPMDVVMDIMESMPPLTSPLVQFV
ncbi:hypothetical protein K450DRAFT_247437 [Umbelopsis ramanniana AG]|uniref:BZIP domain-containing protein n=1 Tax=Umbelopsis ramanniana AG TaxID=1314678 RepID=A0AAD5E7U4_UMBRA|nr:uncharacterized protein K450DRAFT_247437 [Umbelopsis ramanniana AG]KAI8578337.1 hypothetical protein K450DRAFT_247437 [Umbelopsis ramanniana AG]